MGSVLQEVVCFSSLPAVRVPSERLDRQRLPFPFLSLSLSGQPARKLLLDKEDREEDTDGEDKTRR